MGTPSIGREIAEFASSTTYESIPADVLDRAKLLMLDTVGIGFASTRYDFARISTTAVQELAGDAAGSSTVLGNSFTLPLRDAVFLNGVLVHGLDFDDTHPEGVVHASASALPTALGVAERAQVGPRDLLVAYVIGLEVIARLGSAAQGGFHQVGFHPTGLIGAFGAAVIAAKLQGGTVDDIQAAQGVVGSFASGTLEFLESGAWTKRAHPGWAGVAGITAATLARHGFVAPEFVYEGRFGLYATHLAGRPVDLSLCVDGLGTRWETMQVAVKPFPACHFTHAFADAILELRKAGLTGNDVESIHCLIAEGEIETVFEPSVNKLNPRSSYDAQFSAPYVAAAALVRGEFSLRELDDASLVDREILELASRVTYEADPDSSFPKAFSGEVVVRTKDGRTLRHREQINRGAGDRPLTQLDIESKFRANAGLVVGSERVESIIAAVTTMDSNPNLSELAHMLALP